MRLHQTNSSCTAPSAILPFVVILVFVLIIMEEDEVVVVVFVRYIVYEREGEKGVMKTSRIQIYQG